jgi:deoxyribodipyrimidine photo-lyase
MTPTREAGLARLAAFTPHMGEAYAARRNFDAGPGAHNAVSCLSAWLAHRLLTEDEVIAAARAAHGAKRAEKFIQEVLWRTYWKGWLEQHPAVWQDYREAVASQSHAAIGTMEAVAAGHTGIACMDSWAQELVETGYLHNHARMWFASIWCFSLRLPWQLGADFFLRHLLDADAASNTLSWRWVAGLQTRGKHYVARAENISRYTGGRFNPAGELNEAPAPLPLAPAEPKISLTAPPPPPQGCVALLLHEDDLLTETLPLGGAEVVAVSGIAVPEARSHAGCAPLAAAWARGALADGLNRAARYFGVPAAPVQDVAAWADAARCKTVVTPYAPVGWTADRLATIEGDLAARDIRLIRIRRPWDGDRWPHANGGFFAFAAAVNR